jgi:3-O-alpha-D-mannopyranosyl-alpha-D-mannopyranose xylosylphosphotransferase
MDTCPYNDEEWAKFKKLKGRPTSKSKLRPAPPTECTFDVDACLPANFWDDDAEFSADEMFKSLAFKRYKCGDCIIDALVTASGTNSLKAFLPPADKMYTPSPDREPQLWDRPEPILPLTDTWEAADFTLANNVRLGQDEWTRVFPKEEWNEGQVSLLDWSVKLLSRYAYVYGTSLRHLSSPDQSSIGAVS